MAEIFLLLKADMLSLFGVNKMLHGKDRSGRAKLAGGIALIVMIAALTIGLSAFYTFGLVLMTQVGEKEGFLPPGASESVTSVAYAVASVIILLYATGQVRGLVFGGKDYAFLSSLPLSSVQIVVEKVLFVYLSNAVFFALIFLPSNLVYGVTTGAGLLFFVRLILVLPFGPVLPVLIGAAIGTLFAWIAPRGRFASLLQLVLSVALFALYFVFFFSLGEDEEAVASLVTGIERVFLPSALLAKPVVTGEWGKLLLGMAISVVAFAVYAFAVAKLYRPLNARASAVRGSGKKFSFAARKRKDNSSLTACLVRKECRKFFSSPMIVMNSASGVLMVVVFSVIVLMGGGGIPKEMAGVVAVLIPMFGVQFFTYACVSLSLEGKAFWILRSSPLRPWTIVRAKIVFCVLVSVPVSLVASVVLGVATGLSGVEIVVNLLLVAAAALLNNVLVSAVGIRFASFDWENEVKLIKQSAASFVAMLVSMGEIILSVVPTVVSCLALGSPMASSLALTAFYAAGAVAASFLLRSYADRKMVAM